MRIPILKLPFDDPMIAAINRRVAAALASGQLVLGRNHEEFERRWREVNPCAHAVACSSGTSALEIILRALELTGGEVIVPTNTFFASAAAVVKAGHVAVLAEVSPEHGGLTAATVAAAATARTRAVLTVHLGGIIPAEIHALRELCAARGWRLVEDCAHAHACTLDGTPAGAFGVAGAFSFFPTKVFTTGEGGMISTSDAALAARARVLRNHGKELTPAGTRHTVTGDNWRLSELHAAVGCEVLARAGAIIAARRAVAAWYDERMPTVPRLRPVPLPAGLRSTYYKYLLLADEDPFDRAMLKEKMAARGVALTGEVYAEPLHTQPVVATEPGQYRTLGLYPGAERFARRHCCLPLYPGLTEADADYVVAQLRDCLGQA